MTRHEPPAPDGTTYTPFEQELVNALNDAANTPGTPHFDAAGIKRRARRRRTTAVVGLAVGIGVVCGGTALATVTHRPSPPPSAIGAAAPKTSTPAPKPPWAASMNPAGTVEIAEKGKQVVLRIIDVTGLPLGEARRQLADVGSLTIGTVTTTQNCATPGTVASVYPHSPRTVPIGGTINLVVCE